MSVHGEFKRVLAELAVFLNATDRDDCSAAASELDARSAASAKDGLSDAARGTLEVMAALDAQKFTPAQRAEWTERSEHLASICHSLLP